MKHNEVIKNISHNQHEILFNIMQMHNNGSVFDCDMTYSKGKFYGKFKINYKGENVEVEIPQPKYKFDTCPQTEDTIKIETLGALPLKDNSISSIVIDLPFVITKGKSLSENNPGQNLIHKRFSGYSSPIDLYRSYSHWIREAYRVLKDGGICVFKCQNTISGGKFYCTEEFSWMEAQKQGFYVLDRAILCAKNRLISGKVKNQMHFRNFSSTFWVFKKGKKYQPIDYYRFKDAILNKTTEYSKKMVTCYYQEIPTIFDEKVNNYMGMDKKALAKMLATRDTLESLCEKQPNKFIPFNNLENSSVKILFDKETAATSIESLNNIKNKIFTKTL